MDTRDFFDFAVHGLGHVRSICHDKWAEIIVRNSVLITASVVGILAGSLSGARPVAAENLSSLLLETVATHDKIIGKEADVRAARNTARETLGEWFPVLEPTANYGYEHIVTPGSGSTSLPFREFDLSLTQLLWDFGSTDAAVEKSRLELELAELELAVSREDLILESVEAYVNLLRSSRIADFNVRSKNNILEQTSLEEALVESGTGLSTDVLQAKAQLAGANARLIQSNGALLTASNRFYAVFNKDPNTENLEPVMFPAGRLPNSLQEAVDKALAYNTSLKRERINEEIARVEVHETFGSEFFPSVEGTVERKWKQNVSGVDHFKREFLAKIELSIPINLGMTAVNTLNAAQSNVVSKARVVADTVRTVEEEVRNAWQELTTAQDTADSLEVQAGITRDFLALAREERKLGQRTLIDVLSNETNLINAQSDAESAHSDVLVAAYKLLKAIGDLNLSVFPEAQQQPTTAMNSLDGTTELDEASPEIVPMDNLVSGAFGGS